VRQHAVVVYEKAGIAGRSELAAYFLHDLMLSEEERTVLAVPTAQSAACPRATASGNVGSAGIPSSVTTAGVDCSS
jgi:hypothetical protein